jgi:hypothetical protein
MGLFDEETVHKENHTMEDRILQPIRKKFRIGQTIFSAIMKIVADSKKIKLMAG